MVAIPFLQWVLDLLAALWVMLVFGLLFLLAPYTLRLKAQRIDRQQRFIRSLMQSIGLVSSGVMLLACLGLFNWLTLVVWYGFCLYSPFLGRDRCYWHDLLKKAQKLGLILIDALDLGPPLPVLLNALGARWRRCQLQLSTALAALRTTSSTTLLNICALCAVLGFAVLLRFEHPLLEVRFANPSSYQTLLDTQQLLSGQWTPGTTLPVFPAIAAALSLLASVHPAQVIRFLDPIVGLGVLLALGYCLWQGIQRTTPALLGMYGLGAYLFTWPWPHPTTWPEPWQTWLMTLAEQLNLSLVRQWTGGNLALGVLFFLLALTQFPASLRQGQSPAAWVNGLGCSAIALMAAPALGWLFVPYAVGRFMGRSLALWGVGLGWVGLGGLAAFPNSPVPAALLHTLAIALSLLTGLLLTAALRVVQCLFGSFTAGTCLALSLALSLNFLLPVSAQTQYVEYEIAARKAIALSAQFDAKHWMIVAPIEQLAQTLGDAWYEDLARFVDQYAERAGQAEFQFPMTVPDVFIFVEKRPFITFATTPTTVPDALAFDAVYWHYRSTAGRASLQYRALQLCELYRASHTNLAIEFEDDVLRIYHLKPVIQPQPPD